MVPPERTCAYDEFPANSGWWAWGSPMRAGFANSIARLIPATNVGCRPVRRISATALAVVALSAAVAAPAQAELPGIPKPGHGWLDCGNMQPATYDIRARHAACSTARKVARKAFRKMSARGQFGRTRAKGYRCSRRVSLYDGSVYGCRRGRKQVRFYIGG